jgi:hypothetical protein
MTLPTKLPGGLPGQLTHTGGSNPTTPGMHNFLGGPRRKPPTIEGILLEDGHGHLPVELQIVNHLYDLARTGNPEALRSLYGRLLTHHLDHGVIKDGLTERLTSTISDKGDRIWPDDVISQFFAQFEKRDELAKWQPGGLVN